MNRPFLAMAVISFVCTPAVLAKPKHTVQRGAVFPVEVQVVPNVLVQGASLTWQAYHHVDPMTGRVYDEVSPGQRLMATGFHCDAPVIANDPGVTLSCKVPLDVADAIYYLTSISIRAADFERTYYWQDEPFYVEVQVKGGEQITPPYVLSIRLK